MGYNNELDLDKFVNSILGLSLKETLTEANREIKKTESLLGKKEDYRARQYYDHIVDFLFFINVGGVGYTGINGLRKFEPLIKDLVSRGCLPPSLLSTFD